MIFSKFFHLSREGSKTIMQAGIWLALFNLAALLPVVLLAMVSEDMMAKHFAGDGGNIPLLPYAAALLVILTVMFLTYKVAYHKEYLTSGQEEYKLRMELADKLRRLPLSFFGMRDLSDVTGIIMDDVQTMSHVLSQSAAELIGGILTGIVALVVLFIYDWRLALYLAVCMPVVLLVMALSRKISEGTNKKNRSKKLDVSAGLQEYLENIKLLRTTEAMGDYQQGLCKKVKHIIPGLVLYELLAGLSISISYNVMRVGLGLVILFGSGMLAAGEITLFKFLIFLYAAVRIYEPLTSACEHLGDFIASLVGAGRVSALLTKPEQGGSEDITVDRFDIRFDHVRFAYNHEEVLHDVSFTAKQGEITALVGPSGSGKTTLCNLMARFWDVQGGSVCLGGRDVREYSYDSLIRNFSFVFQRVYLFSDTIANNIRFGKPDASMEDVKAAAKKARCYDFIMALPNGFDTVIGEGGATLSGGERQRISIARAIMKDAPVIILDEATANVDPENEKELMEAIAELTHDKTVVMIAHRLKTVHNADKIFVVDHGELVQQGTHDELMAVDGLYRRFVVERKQAAGWKV